MLKRLLVDLKERIRNNNSEPQKENNFKNRKYITAGGCEKYKYIKEGQKEPWIWYFKHKEGSG